jgi:uroporphyrinogen-III synthase
VSLPLIVIRPEPGCAASVAGGLALGLDAHGFPMFEVGPRAWAAPDGPFDGLLVGSANAVRHGGPALERLRGIAVHAVGETTAEAARAAGFTVASVGASGLQAVLDGLTASAHLLRLAGQEHVALAPPPGTTLETRIVYASRPKPMPAELAEVLRSGAVVLLHSAAAARHFAGECDRWQIPRAAVRLAALGPRVAEAAGVGWAECRAASAANEAALLALAADLCHARARREGR